MSRRIDHTGDDVEKVAGRYLEDPRATRTDGSTGTRERRGSSFRLVEDDRPVTKPKPDGPLADREWWRRGFTVETRKAKSGRQYTEADIAAIVTAHRAAFIDYACEHLDEREGETLRDRESDLSIEAIARLRGASIATIRRRRKRLLPKLEALWRRWAYSTWRNGPDVSPFPYARARRSDRDH